MQNQDIARVFHQIADILEMQQENPFRIRSYRNAAITIENLSEDLKSVYEKGKLRDIPGVGESIAEKIEELLKTQKCTFHQQLLKKIPQGLIEIMRVPGMGPKSAMLVYKKLGVKGIEDLKRAALEARLQSLPRMGEKLQKKILNGIEQLKASEGRFKLVTAISYAEAIREELKKSKAVKQLEFAGSLRRKKEMIGDVDILATSDQPQKIMDAFCEIKDIDRVLAKGDTKSSVVLKCGLQVDVRVLEPESFGAALLYFTGSKEHNIAIRDLAKKIGLKVSEYGIFRGKKRIAGKTEEECYKALGFPYIMPELRENRGEIQAAKAGRLPLLIEEKDIRGDLHMHTKESDGKNTIEEMAESARKKGYEYIAITEHSKAVRVAHGLDEKRLLKHIEKIERLNKRLKDFIILKGIEVDIKADGSLDLKDQVLAECDIVVAAVHSKFSMARDEMTRRIIKAMENKNVDIIAHPTGRLLKEREPYQVDMEKVLQAAKGYGVVMELNAFSDRLDLNDIHCKLAKGLGVKISIGTDAHNSMQLDNMRFGIYTARRGWLEKSDVINTLPVEKVLRLFANK